MSILGFLGLEANEKKTTGEQADAADTDTVRRIIRALEALDPERARYVASFAYILSRVANSDRDISPDETTAMERIVMEHGNLPEDQAIMVVQMAKSQNRLFGGVENFLVTREFNKIATREQKLGLVHCMFAVSSTDRSIVSAEATEIRQIASELNLSHQDFIDVKTQYRQHLEVFKDRPTPSD